jgi:hypothetical protein
MYDFVLMLHSYWAYFVLIMLVVAVVNAVIGLTGNKEYNAKAFRISLFTLIVSHIQFVLGLVLYFVSPRFGEWAERGMAIMGESSLRLYLVEHPLINIIAVTLITIGYSKHKKKEGSSAKFKTILVFYAIGLVLLLSRIPWDVWPTL